MNAIPTFYNENDQPTNFGNLIDNPDKLTMASVQFNATITWNTPDFNSMEAPDDQTVAAIDPENDADDRKTFQCCV